MDEVTFLITLIDENWTNATVDTGSGKNAFGDSPIGTSSHRAKPLLIDVKNFTPSQGKRVDIDSTDIVIFYEESASISHPTY